MKRILLKLSGEAISGNKGFGFDEATVVGVAKQVKQIVDAGVEVGIVIGGGNFWRGRTSNTIDRTKADQIGMLATVMNCIYVSEIFRSQGLKTNILTPFECGSMTKLFSKDRANKYFEKGMVVFFAGGTGHPYFSTDTATALRAIERDDVCTGYDFPAIELIVRNKFHIIILDRGIYTDNSLVRSFSIQPPDEIVCPEGVIHIPQQCFVPFPVQVPRIPIVWCRCHLDGHDS